MGGGECDLQNTSRLSRPLLFPWAEAGPGFYVVLDYNSLLSALPVSPHSSTIYSQFISHNNFFFPFAESFIPMTYSFYNWNPVLPHSPSSIFVHPLTPFPSGKPSVCPLYLWVCFSFVHLFVFSLLFRFHI